MDPMSGLRAQRDGLEQQLLALEQAIEAQRARPVAEAEAARQELVRLAARLEELLGRLRAVNQALSGAGGDAPDALH